MREKIRNGLIGLILILSVSLPYVFSGYSEIRKAEIAPSHLDAATHYLAAALRLPWRPDLYEISGNYLYHAGEYTQANDAYQEAFNRNALSPEGWVAWGDVNYRNGDPERAAELWKQGLEQPNASINLYSRLALIYQENKDYSKATEYLQIYVQDKSDDASAHYRLGLLLTLSDPKEALPHLINASQLDPQFDPAVQTLRTALNLSSLSDVPSARFVIIGRYLGLINEWKLAYVAFDKAVTLDEKNAEAWAWLGEADQQTGGDDALKHLDRAVDLNPDSPVVRGLRGLYFQRIANHRQSLGEYQVAAKLEPENPVWYFSIGEEFLMLGDLIRALEAYQYPTVLDPDDAEHWRLLAEFCARNYANVRDVGIPAAQQAVVLAPDDPRVFDVLGWLLVLDGRYYEAEIKLKEAIAIDPQLASAHFHLALLYMQTDDRTSMFDQLAQARNLGSAEAETLLRQEFP